MATNIKSSSIGGIFIQSGNGIPNHIANIGAIFIDIDVPSGYLSNGNGSNLGVLFGGNGMNGFPLDMYPTTNSLPSGDGMLNNMSF